MQFFVWILAIQTFLSKLTLFIMVIENLGSLSSLLFLHKKANINGKWVGLNANFTHANGNFKLIGIQATCVVVENVESKVQQSICQSKPKFIKEK